MADTIINEGNGTFKTEGAVGMKEVRDFLPGKDGLLASSFEVTDFPGSVSLKKLYDESSAGRIVLAGNASYPSENYSLIGFRGSSYRNPTISHELNGGQELFTITISAQNTESTDTWEYKIGEGSWQQGGAIATTTKTVTNVSSGTYSIAVRLKDSQGTVIATSIQKSISVSSVPTTPTPPTTPTTIAGRLNDIPDGTVARGEVVLVGPFAAINQTTYTKSGNGWNVTGFNTGVNRVEFRDNNGTTQARYTGPGLNPAWYNISFAQRPGSGANSGYTVVMESLYMPDHSAAWYSSTAINNAISG